MKCNEHEFTGFVVTALPPFLPDNVNRVNLLALNLTNLSGSRIRHKKKVKK